MHQGVLLETFRWNATASQCLSSLVLTELEFCVKGENSEKFSTPCYRQFLVHTFCRWVGSYGRARAPRSGAGRPVGGFGRRASRL